MRSSFLERGQPQFVLSHTFVSYWSFSRHTIHVGLRQRPCRHRRTPRAPSRQLTPARRRATRALPRRCPGLLERQHGSDSMDCRSRLGEANALKKPFLAVSTDARSQELTDLPRAAAGLARVRATSGVQGGHQTHLALPEPVALVKAVPVSLLPTTAIEAFGSHLFFVNPDIPASTLPAFDGPTAFAVRTVLRALGVAFFGIVHRSS